MRQSITTLFVCLVGGMTFAGPALAAPVTVQSESSPDDVLQDPSVAVDDAGSAHVAWTIRRDDGSTAIVYCRIPRNGDRCATQQTFPVDLAGGPQAFVRYQAPATLTIMTRECCENAYGPGNSQVVAFTSTDGGASFGPKEKLAPGPDGGGGETAFEPMDAVLGAGTLGWAGEPATGPARFQADALGGGPATMRADIFSDNNDDAAVGLVDQSAFTPLVVAAEFGPLVFRRYTGGDPNAETSWTPEQQIDDVGSSARGEPELAEGPAGLFLVYSNGTASDTDVFVRRFDGSSFGGAVNTGLAYGDGNDIAQDGSGTLYVVADDNRDIKLATSSDNGATWSQPQVVVDGESGLGNIHIDVAPDGGGWVVYRTGSGAVRAVELSAGGIAGGAEVPCPGGTGPGVRCFAAQPGSAAQFAAATRRLCKRGGLSPGSTVYSRAFLGSARDERIVGTNRNDVVLSYGGEDDVNARGGKDCVITAAGDDDVDGGRGADQITSGDEDDEVDGGDGNDRILGGRGRDRLNGGRGSDRVIGGAGNDRLRGSAGRDRLVGGAGGDRLIGGLGNDRLVGKRGRDVFLGGSGSDAINARGQRRELVNCGAGRDAVRTKRPERDRIRANCERIRF